MNNENFCLFCGKKIKNNKKFCNPKCLGEYNHLKSYNDFLLNPEKFKNGSYTPKYFKDFFLKEQNFKCEICGNTNEWEGKVLVFVLDHIDGDSSNNERKNLRLICPNCDSQTETFKSKNKNSSRRNYLRDKIERKIKSQLNNN